MSKIQLVVLALFITLSAHALKLDDLSHYAAYDNPQDYLQGLLSQQSNFQNAIDTLSGNLNKTTTDVTAENDIAKKIDILEKGILNQEDQIFVASTKLIPVLVLKDQCSNITETDKTAIIQKCQSTVLDIQTLLTKLKSMTQDARVQEMTASANHQIYYLETIQKVLK